MLTYQAFYQHELQKLILDEIERRKDNLSRGSSADDFPAYKHQVGIIEGLRMALQLSDDAESIANGAEK